MRREKGKADFFCERSAFFFSENVWNVSSENHIFILSFSRRISFPVHFLSFHVIFFLRKLLWNKLAGAWGRSLQRYLKSVCPSSALVMVNSFMVSSCIEKNSSRFFNWCRFGAAGISPPPDARTSEPFLRVVLLLNKTDNKSRQTTDRGESFILTFRVTPSSQYPPPLTWSPSL